MRPIARAYLELTPAQQKRLHLRLCERALEVWTAYAAEQGPIVYVDSVVGIRHTVEAEIPGLALAAARDERDTYDLDYRYTEPIVALQDTDLELPGGVELAYYALYNLFRKYALGADVDGWLVVNQALSALDETEWERAFEAALADVERR